MNYPENGAKGLNTAIDLFKQAIQYDSTYSTAYINLSTAYDHKGSYKDEMIISNKLLLLTNNAPATLILRGILFEKMNNIDSAKKIYYLAKLENEKKLVTHPDDVHLIEQLIELNALTEGKDAAIKELNAQVKMHPSLSSKLSYEYDFYKDFDRHAFIFGLTVETR